MKQSLLTFPIRSDFENGWYGISLNWGGIVFGPHPVGLSWITGGSNLSVIALNWPKFQKFTFYTSGNGTAAAPHHTCHAKMDDARLEVTGNGFVEKVLYQSADYSFRPDLEYFKDTDANYENLNQKSICVKICSPKILVIFVFSPDEKWRQI